ncbi:SDR family NAD(P)-dependent oxidoreductase, partial [Pseudomonadota bacterium]
MSNELKSESGGSPWRLDGARALITGASSGIGLAAAHEFAALGADLLLVARGAERLERARSEILALCPERSVQVLAADVATVAGREQIRAEVGDSLQILVNNAGTNIRKRMSEL